MSVKLGEHIMDASAKRDATHVACVPVYGIDLYPGAYVRFTIGSTEVVKTCRKETAVGIIDPFLYSNNGYYDRTINEHKRVWMLLLPETITNLRHEYDHPAFNVAPPVYKNESHKWLVEFADSLDITYEELYTAATDYIMNDGYFTLDTSDTEVPDEFWGHFEVMSKIKVPVNKRNSFFNCSC